ncbi:hypothetical protein GWI33_013395, partial [Rhynchophorus ferrugineus]
LCDWEKTSLFLPNGTATGKKLLPDPPRGTEPRTEQEKRRRKPRRGTHQQPFGFHLRPRGSTSCIHLLRVVPITTQSAPSAKTTTSFRRESAVKLSFPEENPSTDRKETTT